VEKVLYLLRAGVEGAEALGARIVAEAGPLLEAAGVAVATANVVDAQVAPAAGRRLALSSSPADAVVSVWVPSAAATARAPVDAALAGLGAAAVSALLVTESAPLAPPPTAPGARREGMAQVAFLRRPADLDRTEWLRRWLDEHTAVAIATQATFAYLQHVVVRHLTPGAPEWDAVVEEAFPAAAMADDHAFYDAVGDDDRLRRHQRELFASVERFVDLAHIDVLPTTHHRLV
jgi:hypothetical protein